MSRAPGVGRKRLAGTGVFIAAWTFFDGMFMGLPIMVSSGLWRPVIVFVLAAAVWAAVNLYTCSWIDREWDGLVAGTSFEEKLERLRRGKRTERAVERITSGDTRGFAVAAVLTSAGQVAAVHRLATGRPAGARRQYAASIAPAIFYAGLYSTLGWLARDIIRAL